MLKLVIIGQSVEISSAKVQNILSKRQKIISPIKKFRELLDRKGFLIYNDLV